MSLTSALSIAQSALYNTSRQTSVVSRNITEQTNPDYARRAAVLSSTAPGARVAEIRRATNELLFRQNLSALSGWHAQSTLTDGLDRLRLNVNGLENINSPSAALGKLQTALQTYASTPSNRMLAESAIDAARGVVRSLNDGTQAIQTLRADADQEIAASVDELNQLLADFETVNKEVVSGTRTGRDVSDALDRRDALLKQISAYVPVSAINRGDNDLMLTTADGATLFETVPRTVTFVPNQTYAPGMTGNAVYIDGVPLSAGNGGNTTASGSLAAQLQLRDQIAVQMQRQLDEVARGLISSFAETADGLPDAAGLFTWPGGPDLPTSSEGLAGSIRINPAVDPGVGGNPELLRDGGINGAAYLRNESGGASYSELLNSYIEKLDEPMSFDPESGLTATQSLLSYSSESISWLESLRKTAVSSAEAKEALAMHTYTALSNATGVNMDEEMAMLLELEHAYQASARLIAVVNEMLATLLEAAR